MHERMQMLEDVIQHVLLEHEVSTDQVLHPILHSATGQPVHVWSVHTGNAFETKFALQVPHIRPKAFDIHLKVKSILAIMQKIVFQ